VSCKVVSSEADLPILPKMLLLIVNRHKLVSCVVVNRSVLCTRFSYSTLPGPFHQL